MNCLELSIRCILKLRVLVPLLLLFRLIQRAFVSFSNNPIMSGIKLIGSGKFILRENTFFDLKYDLNSGSTPIAF